MNRTNVWGWSRTKLANLLMARGQQGANFDFRGNTYTLVSIEREDGSGSSFNVTARKSDGITVVHFYIRTED